MKTDEGKFRVLFRRGVVIKGSKRLRNYGSLDYDSLVAEISSIPISDVKNVFHDDKTPPNKRQFTGVEMLALWEDAVKT